MAKLEIVHGDITKVGADAIVNAANNQLKIGGGVCGAIFRASGIEELTKECDAIEYCETGKAVMTTACGMSNTKHIVHTAGPVWHEHSETEGRKLLSDCYTNSMKLAESVDCSSIAFPLISSGIYGCHRGIALEVAIDAILQARSDMGVTLVLYAEAGT